MKPSTRRVDAPKEILERMKLRLIRLGYRVEVSDDGREERVIRPDGSVAVIAKRTEKISG